MEFAVKKVCKGKAINLFNRGMTIQCIPKKLAQELVIDGKLQHNKDCRTKTAPISMSLGLDFKTIESISRKEYCNEVDGYHFHYYVMEDAYREYMKVRKEWDEFKKDCGKELLDKYEIKINDFINSRIVGKYDYSTLLKRVKG